MEYNWDPKKEQININKHGITFSEAVEILESDYCLILKGDTDHSEDRFVFLGLSKKLKILVVVVAYPEEELTRIISARKATKKERSFYEKRI